MTTALITTLSSVFEPGGMVLSQVAETMLSSFVSTPNKKKWLEEASTVLQFANALEERNSLVRGLILKIVHDKWDDVRLENRSPYYRFYDWASRVSGKDEKTINNWMRAADVFILNPRKIDFPKTVEYEIVTSQVNGKMHRETVTIDFDPEKIQHSKLVVACRQVVDGEMTEVKWSALSNPDVSFSRFLEILHGDKPTLEIKERERSFVKREGPILYRHFGPDDDVEILEFNLTEFDNESSRVRRDINDVLNFLGVK